MAEDRERHPKPRSDGRRAASIAVLGSALIAAALTTGPTGSSFAAQSDAGVRNGWITASRTQLITKAGLSAVDPDGAHRNLLKGELPAAPSVASPDRRRFASVLGNPRFST
jgi:hypothetical protein